MNQSTMKVSQPIHFLKFDHQTARTPKGQRRSPVQGPSYDADIMLHDRTTGNPIYRRHTDDTIVIYNEIFSNDKKTTYGDKSIPVKERIEKLWNDVYEANANDKERVRAYAKLAIPYFLTQDQVKELTKRLGEYFCTNFNRPAQLSVHWKTGEKPNHHIHISLTERELKNGKFQQKRKKIYKDMDGNLIYNKIYKDERGWDIREPLIDFEKVPADSDPYERNPETGDYLYQKLDKQNRKQWNSDTHIGKWLEEEDLSKMHDDVDKIINDYIRELGYDVTVKRTDKRIIKILRENNLQQIRVPERDYKSNSNRKSEIDAENSRRKFVQKKLERNLEKRDHLENEISADVKQNQKLNKIISASDKEISLNQKKLAEIQQAEKIAIQQYINSELRPKEIFISNQMQPYQVATNFKNSVFERAEQKLFFGITRTSEAIKNLEKSSARSNQDEITLKLLRKNLISWQKSYASLMDLHFINNAKELRTIYENQWNDLSGKQKVDYITNHSGNDAGELYRDYLIDMNQYSKNKNSSLPKNISFEEMLDKQNIKNQLEKIYTKWTDNAKSDLHYPPAPEDFDILTAVGNAPLLIKNQSQKEKEYSIVSAIPKDYSPEQDLAEYQKEIANLKTNEERNSGFTGNPIWIKFQKSWNSNPYTAVKFLQEATERNKIEYSEEVYKKYFKKYRDDIFNQMVIDILEKTKTEKPYLTKQYLQSHKITASDIGKQYTPELHENWRQWGKISSKYYQIGHPNQNQKTNKQENQRDGMERTL